MSLQTLKHFFIILCFDPLNWCIAVPNCIQMECSEIPHLNACAATAVPHDDSGGASGGDLVMKLRKMTMTTTTTSSTAGRHFGAPLVLTTGCGNLAPRCV